MKNLVSDTKKYRDQLENFGPVPGPETSAERGLGASTTPLKIEIPEGGTG
jgi:hypothetical protein